MYLITWYPFQSRTVKEIYQHMTEDEKRKVGVRSPSHRLWELFTSIVWLGVTLLMLRDAFMPGARLPWALLVGFLIFYAALSVSMMRAWLRVDKKFLASTEWAKAQGYTVDKIHWFSFRRG